MFLQNYMFQAINVLMLAHTQPENLHTPDDKSADVNWDAISYGSLEFKAMARRYLHFSMPCMALDLWAKGMWKTRVTYANIEKRTSELARELNRLCYGSRDVGVAASRSDDVVRRLWLNATLTPPEITRLYSLLRPSQSNMPSLSGIPVLNSEDGYRFFCDCTPYDTSYNLLLTEALRKMVDGTGQSVLLPNTKPVFGPDDYFVIDQLRSSPSNCLGPETVSSIIKRIKLLAGREAADAIETVSIRDLREYGLWHPTEFEQLILLDGTTLSATLKSVVTGVTAPIALYWSWCEKVSQPNCPRNAIQWVHKELCDKILPGGVYDITLDDANLKWLLNNGIVRVPTEVTDGFFVFPDYDRTKYAERPLSERGQGFEEWAWSSVRTVSIPKHTSIKVVGCDHKPYSAEWDITENIPGTWGNTAGFTSFGPSNVEGRMNSKLSSRALEFLRWARETEAPQDSLFKLLRCQEVAPNVTLPSAGVPISSGVCDVSGGFSSPRKNEGATLGQDGPAECSEGSSDQALSKPSIGEITDR